MSQITIEVYEGAEYINGSLSINSSNQVVGTVKKNETQSTRTIKYKLKTSNGSVCYDKTATQGKGCDCSSFSVTARSVGKDAGTYTFATYTADPCITEITATENADWITAIGVNTTDKTITGSVTSNTITSKRTTIINVSGKAGTLTCPLSFELTQSGVDCDCDKLNLSPTSLSWEWDSVSSKPVTITADACVDVNTITVTSSSNHFSVTRIGTTINIRPIATTVNVQDATVTVSYTAGTHTCTSSITVHQDAKGCPCNCSQVVKVNNEEGEPWYTYSAVEDVTAEPYKPTSNVPFAILTASSSFNCDDSVTAVTASTGFESIFCIKYDASSTLWNGGWKDTYYSKFRTYCSGLAASSNKVFIVYGTLSDLPENAQSRVLTAKYKVCNDPCDTTLVNIYQRCACGMDNCRNEYQDASGLVVEDRPLYINACPSSNIWMQGDSVCVENLSLSSVTYYEQDTNGNKYNEVTIGPRQIREYNSSGKGAAGNQGLEINDDPIPLRVSKGHSTDSSGNPVYGVSGAWNEMFQVQVNVVSWQRSVGRNDYVKNTIVAQRDSNNNPLFSIYLHYTIEPWDPVIPNPDDPSTTIQIPPVYGYPYGLVVDGETYYYPLQGMVQYIVDAPLSSNREQVWQITYTTNSEVLVGGMVDHGKCALKKFTCTIYRAPTGHRYNKNMIDERNKAEMIICP